MLNSVLFLRSSIIVAALVALSAFEPAAMGQDRQERRREKPRVRDRRGNAGGPTGDAMEKIQQLQEQAKRMGPWEQEAQLIHQAHVNIFQTNGWTSESDQFALGLMQQVTNISPWNPREREEAFLNGVQTRLNLTADQRKLVADEMKREAMAIGMKHFTTMFPVVMEIAQTRMEQKPFTPEQVQKWSQNLKPVMDEALAAVQRTSRKLEGTMNEDQRRVLSADMEAVLRRHKDVEKMVQRWKSGQWNPTEWGLQNDPIHAAAMAEFRATEANRNALVAAAQATSSTSPQVDGSNETEWRKYVQWFVTYYKCDDRQKSQAEGILKSCEKEAADYLRSRGKEMEKAEAMKVSADSDAKKQQADGEIKRLRKPIESIFEMLKKRLDSQVLTTEQRKKMPKETKGAGEAKQAAAGKK